VCVLEEEDKKMEALAKAFESLDETVEILTEVAKSFLADLEKIFEEVTED
jgi:phage-related tail protein